MGGFRKSFLKGVVLQVFPYAHPDFVWRKGVSPGEYRHWPSKSDDEQTRLNKLGVYYLKVLPSQDQLFPPTPYRTHGRLHFTLCR